MSLDLIKISSYAKCFFKHCNTARLLSPIKYLLHTEKKYSIKKSSLSPNLLDDFRKIVGNENVLTSLVSRNQYSVDESTINPIPSDAVLIAHSTQQVSDIAKLCYKNSIPMIPHGSGTGLIRGLVAVNGGVCVDLSKMTNVLKINEADFDVTVESGVTWRALNKYLRDTGLMFSVDPGSDATLGGMAATGASGTNAVRYGTMKTNVLNLEVVLADGTILHTAGEGRRARKSSAGYDLTHLFVGSEGTLGFITKVTLRLYAIPETIVSAVCAFPSEQNAVDTVIEILQSSIPVARMEFLDDVAVAVANKHSKFDYSVAPSLFLEFHGQKDEVECHMKSAEAIARSNSGSDFRWAKDHESRAKLWHARHQLYYYTVAEKPGFRCVTTDICVPITKLPEVIIETKKELQASGLFGTILGHVGDGNFHTIIMFDPNSKEETDKVHKLEHNIAMRSLKLHGTCTGEHGIGLEKMHFLEDEFGKNGINVMKMIKSSLDPKNIMNPGKIIFL